MLGVERGDKGQERAGKKGDMITICPWVLSVPISNGSLTPFRFVTSTAFSLVVVTVYVCRSADIEGHANHYRNVRKRVTKCSSRGRGRFLELCVKLSQV